MLSNISVNYKLRFSSSSDSHSTLALVFTNDRLSSSVYSPFSDRVKLHLHSILSPRAFMKSIAEFIRPHDLSGVNDMHGM